MKDLEIKMAEEVSRVVRDCRIPLMQLSRRSGVAYNTLRAIARGEGNPTLSTCDSIFSAIFSLQEKSGASCMSCAHRGSDPSQNGFFLCELAGLAKSSALPCNAHSPEADNNDNP